MTRSIKIIFSLLLVIAFLIIAGIIGIFIFFGAWLHTYNVLTERTLVAEVTVSPIQKDENGEYFNVEYTPIKEQSALTAFFTGKNAVEPESETSHLYKIYGDSVHIGGPIVKFYDHLALLNFKTIFKVGKLYGRYNLHNDQEVNRKAPATFDLNGGIDQTWENLNEHINEWPYNMLFDTTEISTPGVFASRTETKSYNLYVTLTGYLWEQR